MSSTQVGDAAPQTFGYDQNGRLVYRSDGDQGEWKGEWDGYGRLWKEQIPTGAVIVRRFDAAGDLESETTTSGEPGQPGSETLSVRAARYTSFGEPEVVVEQLEQDPAAEDAFRVTRRYFDTSGRTSFVTSGPASEQGGSTDLLALDVDEARARREVELGYHPLTGQLISRSIGGLASAPGSAALPALREVYDYGLAGSDQLLPWPSNVEQWEQVPGQDQLALARTTSFSRDLLGRALEISSSDGAMVDSVLDRSGALLQESSSEGATESWAYDSRGSLLRHTRPGERGHTLYAYDLDGRLLERLVEHSGQQLGGDPTPPPWDTLYTYDPQRSHHAPWVTDVTHDAGTSAESAEHFAYNGDGTVGSWTTRDAVAVTFTYDAANRLTGTSPAPGAGFTSPPSLEPLDQGDSYAYDAASRLLTAARVGAQANVERHGFDLAGRPAEELVAGRPALSWSGYDAWGNPGSVSMPTGLGAVASFERSYDTLSRLTSAQAQGGFGGHTSAVGADWIWGGAGRPYGVTTRGPLGVATRYSYWTPGVEAPPGAEDLAGTWRLASVSYGTAQGSPSPPLELDHTWGSLGFGWRVGPEHGRRDGAKMGRAVADDPFGLLALTGWAWQPDTGMRLLEAHQGQGSYTGQQPAASFETFDYTYKERDELRQISRSTAAPTDFEVGVEGRIETRDGIPFSYDAVGRRTEDDRYTYTWDWRGRLARVTVKDAWSDGDGGTTTPPFAGHQVRYDYDALGRLLTRVHYGPPDGDGERGLLEKRDLVWEGNGLVAEVAYKDIEETEIRWRKTYLPGPAGLDDQVQVRVESFPDSPTEPPQDSLYTYLRDEMGSVVALVEEAPGADPSAPPQPVARYLYSPYGEAHLVVGPELVATRFDPGLTTIDTPDGPVTQAISEPSLAAAGALVATLTEPITDASLAGEVSLQRRQGDGAAEPVPAERTPWPATRPTRRRSACCRSPDGSGGGHTWCCWVRTSPTTREGPWVRPGPPSSTSRRRRTS